MKFKKIKIKNKIKNKKYIKIWKFWNYLGIGTKEDYSKMKVLKIFEKWNYERNFGKLELGKLLK